MPSAGKDFLVLPRNEQCLNYCWVLMIVFVLYSMVWYSTQFIGSYHNSNHYWLVFETMLGVDRESVAKGLRLAFDADAGGEAVRESLMVMGNKLQEIAAVGTAQAKHLYRIIFKDLGTFIRMHQGDLRMNFPYVKGMPKELIVEPFLPEIDSKHSGFKRCLTEMIAAGIVLGPEAQGGPAYDGILVGMMNEALSAKKIEDKLRTKFKQNAQIFQKDSLSYRLLAMSIGADPQ